MRNAEVDTFSLKTPRFYCVTNPTKGVIKLWQFSAWKEQRLYGYEQPPFTQQGTFPKGKGACCRKCSHFPKIGTTPLQGCPLSTGKVSTLSAPLYGSLKKPGYITRRQGRDEKGKMTAIEYTIYEQPQPPALDCPVLENPTADKPILENPTPDNPTSENPTQLNKELLKTNLPKKKKN